MFRRWEGDKKENYNDYMYIVLQSSSKNVNTNPHIE